eukprot:gene20282-27040_t
MVNSVVATTVAPVIGNLIGIAMFFSPVKAVLEVRRTGDMWDLNPLPFVAIIVNCIGYALDKIDPQYALDKIGPQYDLDKIGPQYALDKIGPQYALEKIGQESNMLVWFSGSNAASFYFHSPYHMLIKLAPFLSQHAKVVQWSNAASFYLHSPYHMLKVVQQGNAASIYLHSPIPHAD